MVTEEQNNQAELGNDVPLVKASVLGTSEDSQSNVIVGVDESLQIFTNAGAIEPPYDPLTLCALLENSNSLRQNVDAYVTNIDAFGHRFEPIIDLDADDADHRIANAILSERDSNKTPTPEEIKARKQQIANAMREEKSRLETFFDFCCVDISFVTLRRHTRQDLETIGNGYWEILRNGAGEIVQLVYVPGFTVRLLPLDRELVEVEAKVKISDLTFDTVKVKRRFRRYMQVFESQTVFFREFGDPRIISRTTGEVFESVEKLKACDPNDGPATEVLHFKLHNPRSAYGTPRWIGNLLSVLGSRQAEEINFTYFENKSVPPLAILVSGGRLSAQSVPRIEDYIETNIKGKRNFHKILILEAESQNKSAENSGRTKIELQPLTAAQQTDALFQNYDERNCDKVGQSFRLPRLLRGDIRDFNRSCYSADTETLTENGWKLHYDITPTEKIAVYDPRMDELRFEVPASKHVARVSEELIHFEGRHTDILVTSDHKMLVKCPDREWKIEDAQQAAKRGRFEFRCVPENDHSGTRLKEFVLPKTCEIERGHAHVPIRGDLWLEFLGYFMSDGGLLETDHPTAPYLVFVRQKKILYRGRMETCLDLLKWKYSTQIKKACGTAVFCISNRCLRNWLAKHCGGRSAGRHLPWEYVTGLPVDQLEILFRAMMDGDGTRARDLLSGAYHTASPVLADQVQAICVRLGFRSKLRWEPGAGVFRIMFAEERKIARLNSKHHVRTVPYEGDVYCYSCPGAGFFVTRRNGKVAIQGNTADAALGFAETQVFQPEREDFDFTINRKILTDMGIRYWRFRSNAPVTRDPQNMAEIVRNLVNGNVLTPEEGRQLAGDVFNREFKEIKSSWVKQPIALTLAQMGAGSDMLGQNFPQGNKPSMPLVPPTAKAASTDLVEEAKRLIALRNALAQAEKEEAQAQFIKAKQEVEIK